MTIEELKALAYADDGGYRSGVAEDLFLALAPETLALVEAANPNNFTSEEEWHTALFNARDAFNARLASL